MAAENPKQKLLRLIGNALLRRVATLLCGSLRVTAINSEAITSLEQQKKRFILGFWHGSMLLPWYLHRNKGYLALTSQSKDGELLARVLRFWGYTVTRGSSSKGGKVALGIITDYLRFESSVLITPDGPRGPQHAFKPGAVVAAYRSAAPLVLAAVGIKRKIRLKSWDRFEIPVPFSRVFVRYSDPIYISPEYTEAEVQSVIERCNNQLNELHEQMQAGLHG